MFTSPNGGRVIIAGGRTSNASIDIVELKAEENGDLKWKKLIQKLNQPRQGNVIIPLGV